jgi:deazaflavin-dependent oxidoreductase (nitroreductase family)
MASGTDDRLKRAAVRLSSSTRFAKIAPYFIPQLDRFLHRISGGRISLGGSAVPELMLTTIGAKTGQRRVSPLATQVHDGDWYVVGSNYGRAAHPAWTANLIANPDTEIAVGRQIHQVRAHLLTADEKAVMWPRLLEFWPAYETYSERSGRELRVFRLDKR